jgi:membrane protein
VLGDTAGTRVADGLADVLPRDLADVIGDVVRDNAGKAGVIGLLGTLFSGLGWIDALREAIRSIWHQNVTAGNLVVRKAIDVVVLVGLFGTIAASVAFSALVTSFTGTALDVVGIDEDATAAVALTFVLGYAVTLVVDTALFLYLFTRLARVRTPWRRVLKGAVFGAIGFEVLKVLGGIYVERSTSKGEATYGTFAVVVGLLLFLNLVSRFLLLTAAFVVTAPYDSDVAPSGTASPEQARKAGIPEEYADATPDDPPALLDDGAPTPLQAAVMGRTPPQHEPDAPRRTGGASTEPTPEARRGAAQAVGRSWSAVSALSGSDGSSDDRPATAGGPAAAAVPAAAPAERPGERAVRVAAGVGIGAMGVLLLAVLTHLVTTLRRLVRR